MVEQETKTTKVVKEKKVAKKAESETKETKASVNTCVFVGFRRSLKHTIPRHYIFDAGCKDREEANKLVGKALEWKSPTGRILKGKIASSHGNNGLIRGIFETGLPGQALNSKVQIK